MGAGDGESEDDEAVSEADGWGEALECPLDPWNGDTCLLDGGGTLELCVGGGQRKGEAA
jgi:hypothetical protein